MSELPIKATYKLAELSDVMGLEDRALVRWLSEKGVPVQRTSPRGHRFVWLADLVAAIPALDRSIALAKAG